MLSCNTLNFSHSQNEITMNKFFKLFFAFLSLYENFLFQPADSANLKQNFIFYCWIFFFILFCCLKLSISNTKRIENFHYMKWIWMSLENIKNMLCSVIENMQKLQKKKCCFCVRKSVENSKVKSCKLS